MAILHDVPGAEVTVNVGGDPLHEYTDSTLDEDDLTTTRYIEAASDQEFEVHITVDRRMRFLGDCIKVEVMTDGVIAHKPLIDKLAAKIINTTISKGRSIGNRGVQNYRFASLETGKNCVTGLRRAV